MAKYWADTGTPLILWLRLDVLDIKNPDKTKITLVKDESEASDIADEIIGFIKGIYKYPLHSFKSKTPKGTTVTGALYDSDKDIEITLPTISMTYAQRTLFMSHQVYSEEKFSDFWEHIHDNGRQIDFTEFTEEELMQAWLFPGTVVEKEN